MITFNLPLRTFSEANRCEHWRKKAQRVKMQKGCAFALTKQHLTKYILDCERLKIVITRMASRELDSDNLASAMKAIRDGIADALGRNDGDKRLDWQYSQLPARRNELSVQITIWKVEDK